LSLNIWLKKEKPAEAPKVKYERSILYYTDNSLDSKLFDLCQKQLIKAAGDVPIISVSQKPINFGKNFCIGDIGRSHLSLFRQLKLGLENIETPLVVLAEHDCMYTPEHIFWDAQELDVFYYNNHQWFAQYGGKNHGLYSHMRRRVLSNLIAGRDIMLKAVNERIELLENGYKFLKGAPGACEPGVLDDKAFVAPEKDLGKNIMKWKSERFSTVLANLDIRHQNNFSGGRIAKDKSYELPYWGKFTEIVA
jgi:hypothetical protein